MKAIVVVLLFGAFTTFLDYCQAGTATRVIVKGKVVCPSSPGKVKGIDVKMADKDLGPNPDDLMAKNKTDSEGNFWLEGTASDPIGKIDPRVKIYHKCNAGLKNILCPRKWNFKIPKIYLNKDKGKARGKRAPKGKGTTKATTTAPDNTVATMDGYKVYDMGILNLEVKLPDETTDCLH